MRDASPPLNVMFLSLLAPPGHVRGSPITTDTTFKPRDAPDHWYSDAAHATHGVPPVSDSRVCSVVFPPRDPASGRAIPHAQLYRRLGSAHPLPGDHVASHHGILMNSAWRDLTEGVDASIFAVGCRSGPCMTTTSAFDLASLCALGGSVPNSSRLCSTPTEHR